MRSCRHFCKRMQMGGCLYLWQRQKRTTTLTSSCGVPVSCPVVDAVLQSTQALKNITQGERTFRSRQGGNNPSARDGVRPLHASPTVRFTALNRMNAGRAHRSSQHAGATT